MTTRVLRMNHAEMKEGAVFAPCQKVPASVRCAKTRDQSMITVSTLKWGYGRIYL